MLQNGSFSKLVGALFAIVFITACRNEDSSAPAITEKTAALEKAKGVSLIVLGTIQDAGSPQIGCTKKCCARLFDTPDLSRKVTALGLTDSKNNSSYLFEASPDITAQLQKLNQVSGFAPGKMVDGIFLTHAHIGHYTGLMYLGKEATNASAIPVYAMPRMRTFLTHNGPWGQLVKNKNIELKPLKNELAVNLSPQIKVIPYLVPHRDEYSETVGYKIIGTNKTALFIPDIDKWEKWSKRITKEIEEVDYAFLDATFYSGEELNNRDISSIPHPFIIESLKKFEALPLAEKSKIHFIHFNHTNPVLDKTSNAYLTVIEAGFQLAEYGQVFAL